MYVRPPFPNSSECQNLCPKNAKKCPKMSENIKNVKKCQKCQKMSKNVKKCQKNWQSRQPFGDDATTARYMETTTWGQFYEPVSAVIYWTNKGLNNLTYPIDYHCSKVSSIFRVLRVDVNSQHVDKNLVHCHFVYWKFADLSNRRLYYFRQLAAMPIHRHFNSSTTELNFDRLGS
jgi:hypothetical protein